MSEKVETIFWGNKAKCQKPFKSIFSHMKLSTKWFWSYFEIKNEYSEHSNLACFYFLQTFEWRSRIGFLGNRGKTLKSNEAFWEMVLKLCWGQKQMLWTFVIGIFLFFVKFWVRKLKAFIGKARQNIKNFLNQNLVIWSFLENGFEANFLVKTNILNLWK